MVTNYPQQLTAARATRERSRVSLVGRAITRLGQLLCGIRGHDAVKHVEGRRVMMRCTSCGYETPGWDLEGRSPRKRFDGDASRHLLETKPRLVLRKTG